jgi:NTP pyrophosphatase (non-canonical NTP hydrolase)
MLTFKEYQTRSQAVRLESARANSIVYPMFGLIGEVGEISEKLKKILRDGKELDLENMKKELGDVLWYLTALAEDFALTLEDIAYTNVNKLESRAQRGVISGSGDNR